MERTLRIMDIVLAATGLLLLWPVLLVVWCLGWFDTGSPLLWQTRVGFKQRPFVLVKFRTMSLDTAHVASHMASPVSVTRIGRVLRRTKLDELPQLWNVLKGEMSLVGPRPCLSSQHQLIEARAKLGVYEVRPGITGLAQVNGIDMSTPDLLAKTDAFMIENMTFSNYCRYLLQTVAGKGGGDAVKHSGKS